MAVSISEGLMVLGAWSADVAWDPSLEPLLAFGRHVRFSQGARAIYTGPITKKRPGGRTRNTRISGRSLEFWLGLENDGSVILFRDHIAGTQKLSNWSFELLAEGWELAENTKWALIAGVPGGARSGNVYLTCSYFPTVDDVVRSTQSFECFPGNNYLAGVWFRGRAGAEPAIPGSLVVRMVFEGAFAHPNLFPTIAAGAWGEQVTNNPQASEPAFTIVGSSMTARTPLPIYQLVENPLFASGFDHWFTDLPPGFGATEWEVDGSAAPDLPTSVHYEGSGFITTDVVITSGSDVLTSATANWTAPSAAGMLVEGPDIPAFTYVVGVSGPGTLQISSLATANHLAGDQSVGFRPQQTSRTYLTTDAANAGTTLSQYPVTKGETWSLYCHVMKTANANGSATINFAKVKTATDVHLAGVFWEQADTISTGGTTVLSTAPEPNVRVVTKQTTIEDETTNLGVFVELAGNTDGRWWFSNFLLQRVIGNKDWITAAAPFAVTGERTYQFRIPVTFGPDEVKEAKARLLVHLWGLGRPPLVMTSSDRTPYDKPTGTDDGVLVFDVTPPSGYTVATPELMIEDVFNSVVTFGEMTVIDKDSTTKVYDALSGPRSSNLGAYRELFVNAAAPAGSQRVHMEFLAEANGGPWEVDDAFLVRADLPKSTGAGIVRELLYNAKTLLPMLAEGVIADDEPLSFDWRIRNLTNRQALEALSRSGLLPNTHEWRVNPDATLDWAYEVGDDRTDIVLTDDTFEVLGPPDVERSWESRVDEVIVLGAESVYKGTTYVVTGSASRASSGNDYFGGPAARRRVIIDPTINHTDWANARARYELDQNAIDVDSIEIALSDDRAMVPCRVGDYIYLWQPESGIEDLDRPSVLLPDGRNVHPQRQRVLQGEWSLGSGFRAELQLLDGSWLDITAAVQWSTSTSVRLQVGSVRPGLSSYVSNPFLKARVSAPR